MIKGIECVCLNVDLRVEEQGRIVRELQPFGITPSFFGCGKGELLPKTWYSRIDTVPDPSRVGMYPAFVQRPNSWNAFHCFKVIVRRAQEFNVEKILILEDDVTFEPNFAEVADKAFADMEKADKWWQMLYLSANHYYRPTLEITPNLLRLAGSGGWHCVVLHRRSFKYILDFPFTNPIDEQCGQHLHPLGHCYAAWPNTACQMPGFSHCEGSYQDYRHFYRSKGNNHEERD